MTKTAFELPRATLEPYLAEHIAGFGRLREIQRFSGGQSNPTYLLTADSSRYVLRRKPPGQLLKSAHAVDREFRVLRALGNSDVSAVPIARALHFCADDTVIGSAFYIMEYVPGRVFWNPELPEVDTTTRATMYDEMNRVLVEVHRVDANGVGLSDFGPPANYFERQIRRWTEQYRACETQRRPDVDRLIEWLPKSLPADDGQVSLVHGDFRLDNMLFDDSGRVVALLDWELSTLGHPYADLAYQCAQWRLPAGLRGLEGIDRRLLGIPTESEYLAAYCRRRGLPTIPGWHFYLALSLFRLAAICQGVYRRGLDGNASGSAALEFGEKIAVIAAHAVEILAEPRHC